MKQKTKYYLFILLFLVSFSLISCKNKDKQSPKIIDGYVDLSNWNFDEDGILNLDGEWNFYWKEFLNPEQFNSINNKRTINLPQLWNNYQIDNEKLGSNGYATFQTKVKLPKKEQIYTLKFNRIESAYKLWIDNELIKEIGEIGVDKSSMKPQWLPADLTFKPENEEITITIQVSNFYHKKGGIDKKIKIGTYEQIGHYSRTIVGFEIFILGALLIMAIYHFGLYILRTSDKSTLYFGIAAFASAIYTTVNGELIFPRLFPDFNWELIVKTNYITNYVRVTFFALFLATLFNKDFSKIFLKIIIAWTTIMIAFVLFTPARIYTHTLIVFFVEAFLIFVFFTFLLIKAIIKKRDGAIFSLIGTFILLLASLNDIFYDSGVINSMYLGSFGMFIFVFFQSFMLSLRSAKSHKAVEILSDRLVVLDEIQKELLSIPSFDLGQTLKILHKNFKSQKSYLIIANDEADYNILAEVNSKNQIVDEEKILSDYFLSDKINRDIFYKSIEDKNDLLINKGTNQSIISSPIFENNQFKALVYFETQSEKGFESKAIDVLRLLKSQMGNIIDNAFTYIKLEYLNQNLEHKVEERTREINRQKEEIMQKNVDMDEMIEELKVNNDIIQAVNEELKSQKEEIMQKNVDMDEMIEELKVNNEIIQSINDELNTQKTEIEQKNATLEQQKLEIMEKHEELLQQKEEILTINEVLEKRQEEILNKNSELETQKDQITKKNQQITDSIEYAKRIQMALLKSEKNIPFKENFILYKPRDIVSGDFYWIKKFFNYVVLVAADCTGHGVPGAFMSMLGISFLSEVTNKHFRKVSKTRLSASIILEDLRDNIIKALSTKTEKAQNKDGMDMALCIIDRDTNQMQFAGAYNSIYIIRDNKINELQADKMPIGRHIKDQTPFFNYEFQLLEEDKIYMFSDGYIDQFGGEKGRKFLKNNFKELLLSINNLSMNEQLEKLENNFYTWKGERKQTDDILVMGFRV